MKIFFHLQVICFLVFTPLNSNAQIDVIKDLASGSGSILSDISSSDVDGACSALSCCWDGGFIFAEFLVDHHQDIMNLRHLNPALLSLEIDATFAYALHYSQGEFYTYINYLPGVRGNLGVFSTDFRYNILTEYADDFPNTFKSSELIFMINIVPSESVKLSFGSGVYYEMYTETYYNEHYFGSRIGTFQNRDFIDLDTRVVMDYAKSRYPFFEAGIHYNTKIINFDHLFGYISLGGIYQNYYQAHDIWAARGGLIFNIH